MQIELPKWLDTTTIIFTIIMITLLIISIVFVGERQAIIDECNQHWQRTLHPEQQTYAVNFSQTFKDYDEAFNPKVIR